MDYLLLLSLIVARRRQFVIRDTRGNNIKHSRARPLLIIPVIYCAADARCLPAIYLWWRRRRRRRPNVKSIRELN